MASGFVVNFEGRPVPWARVKRNAAGKSYTPAKQRDHQKTLAWAIKVAAENKKLDGAVAVNVLFDYERDLTSITVTDAYQPGKTTRPDIDNLCKQVMEALEMSGVIKDDAQVVFITARKV